MKIKDKARKQLIKETEVLKKQVAKYKKVAHKADERIHEYQKKNKDLLHDLYERIKELKCLYGLSGLIERSNISPEQMIKRAVNLFPPSWQYPDITCARISFYDKEFRTDNHKMTKWRQAADIKVFGEKAGFVEVLYLKRKPRAYEGPFLKEERSLINAIAERLGKIIELRNADDALKRSEADLKKQKQFLEQKNIALREIIRQVKIEKDSMGNDIMANLTESVFPILQKLKTRKNVRKYVELLRYHLEGLTSSFGSNIAKKSVKLTPKEIEICAMIKGSLTSKEISSLLNISPQTVEKHRKNIRRKLKISNKGINLISFLKTL